MSLFRISEDYGKRHQTSHTPFSNSDAQKPSGSDPVGNRGRQESWEGLCSKSDQEKTQRVLQAESGQHATRNGYRVHSPAQHSSIEHETAPRGVGPIFRKGISASGRYAAGGLIRLYQVLLSPLFPSACRFYPTCSEYAREAVRVHGVFTGSILALKRLIRCRPFGPGGFDPVP